MPLKRDTQNGDGNTGILGCLAWNLSWIERTQSAHAARTITNTDMPNDKQTTSESPSCDAACSPRIPTPIADQSWASWPYAGPGMSVHDGRRLERDRHKLLQLCERAYSICMGDCEPSDMDDWVTDYNETKREIFWENVKDHSPIGAVSASKPESNSAAPIG